MLANEVHVDNNTFESRPWRKVMCVWIAVGRLQKERRQTMIHAKIVCGAYLHIFFDLEFEVSHSDSSASIEEDN